MSFAKLAELNQTLIRMRKCDRDTFFGREEMVEWIMEEEHAKIGQQWRKFGRYGNVLSPLAFHAALQRLKDEFKFTREEMEEQMEWTKGQGETYGNPDQLVAAVLWKYWLKDNYGNLENAPVKEMP